MASVSSYHDVLIRPLITEKSTRLIEAGQYTFEVHREANKIQIREAVEKTFNVKVRAVNTLNMPRKTRRRGRVIGTVPGWKKAVVTLQEGQTIDIFET
ncbi:MAG: 50S ribosomal protein L23 [Thermomicrobiales bacterium]|jgi:large subunit ribosomal protein L23|nr:50S ribosomal protein L23 [Thermomicrobiales bacterium]